MRRASRACFPSRSGWWEALLLLAALACLGSARAGEVDAVHFTRADMLQVADGSFDAPPVRVDDTALPGTWTEVALPHASLARAVAHGANGSAIVTTWYRLRLDPAAFAAPPQGLFWYLPRWQTVGQIAVYGDGLLIYRSHGSSQWSGFNHPVWLPLAESAGAALPRTLLVRISSQRSTGSSLSTAWVGDAPALHWRYLWREWLQADVPRLASAAFLCIGLFSLAVWSVRRRESIYGLFFAASALFYLRCMHYYVLPDQLPMPEEWFGWFTVVSVGWIVITTYFFAFRLHGRTYPRLERTMVGVQAAVTLLLSPPVQASGQIVQLAPLAYVAMLCVAAAACGVAVWSSWVTRSGDGLLLTLWNAAVLPVAVHDLLLQNQRVDIEHIYLLPHLIIGLFVIFMSIAFRRYVGAIAEVELSNLQLEGRLGEREAQLARSYDQLRLAERREMLAQERQRLMQDMHDGMGSALVSALRVAERGQLGEADVAQLLKECIDDLKLTIDSLEPVETDLLLVLATLRFRVGKRLQAAGMTLRWEVADVPALEWLEPRSTLHILRILQEVFTNIVKHTGADEIGVTTGRRDACVVVSVRDNGGGFTPGAGGEGKGIANMRRRAQAIGASVAWETTARSTCFTLWLPIQSPGLAMPSVEA